MSDEYVLRITRRERYQHLTTEVMLVEAGFDADNPEGLRDSMEKLVELLRVFKTPEGVAEFARKHQVLLAVQSALRK